jgi:hypothetical protein
MKSVGGNCGLRRGSWVKPGGGSKGKREGIGRVELGLERERIKEVGRFGGERDERR